MRGQDFDRTSARGKREEPDHHARAGHVHGQLPQRKARGAHHGDLRLLGHARELRGTLARFGEVAQCVFDAHHREVDGDAEWKRGEYPAHEELSYTGVERAGIDREFEQCSRAGPRRAEEERDRHVDGGVPGDVRVDPLVGGGLKEVAPYIALILILMFKPYGLFGKRKIERV